VDTRVVASKLGDGDAQFFRGKQECSRVTGLLGGIDYYGIYPSRHRIGPSQDVKNLPISLTNMDSKPKPTPAGVDVGDLVTRLIKYLLEGLAVAIAAFVIPGKTMRYGEVAMIALTATATFAILDIYAPSVGSSARTGAGFGIGAGLVGFPA
jgi:hypothetical protein